MEDIFDCCSSQGRNYVKTHKSIEYLESDWLVLQFYILSPDNSIWLSNRQFKLNMDKTEPLIFPSRLAPAYISQWYFCSFLAQGPKILWLPARTFVKSHRVLLQMSSCLKSSVPILLLWCVCDGKSLLSTFR